MRALILLPAGAGLAELGKAVARGLGGAGYPADLREVEPGDTVISTAPYAVVCVGSRVEGLLRGRVPAATEALLTRCRQLAGRRTAVFVPHRWAGTGGALRAFMALLEREGAWVEDFAVLRSAAEAEAWGSRLQNLLTREDSRG